MVNKKIEEFSDSENQNEPKINLFGAFRQPTEEELAEQKRNFARDEARRASQQAFDHALAQRPDNFLGDFWDKFDNQTKIQLFYDWYFQITQITSMTNELQGISLQELLNEGKKNSKIEGKIITESPIRKKLMESFNKITDSVVQDIDRPSRISINETK